MARGGRTSRQISRDIDVPKRIVKEWTAPEREMRKRVRAKRMKELGRNPSQIAARLNIRVKDVERLLAEARDGDPAVSGGCGARHGTDTRKCVRRMAELQDPVSDMAFIVGVTPKTIRNWIRRIEHDEKKSLLPGGRRRTHDRQAILEDLRATDDAGQPRYTRAQIRDKHGCSHKFLSQLANGRIDP
jgi:transposase-like protein